MNLTCIRLSFYGFICLHICFMINYSVYKETGEKPCKCANALYTWYKVNVH